MLDAIFVILLVFYGSGKIHVFVVWLMEYFNLQYNVNYSIWNLIIKISKYLFCPLLALLIGLFYIETRNWLLNNFIGIFLTISAIKYGGIRSFKLMVPILWSLFLYAMYWVYSTDVMVTVAKEINLPLKLQFPYINMVG